MTISHERLKRKGGIDHESLERLEGYKGYLSNLVKLSVDRIDYKGSIKTIKNQGLLCTKNIRLFS